MTVGRIVWDDTTKRMFQTGLDRGVVYLVKPNGDYDTGEGWNGLTKVSESPEGAESNKIYANNNTYGTIISDEVFKGSISAYMYPDSFAKAIGEQALEGENTVSGMTGTAQNHTPFGFTYRTLKGNDTEGTAYGYVIHLVYNATAGVASVDNETVNGEMEAVELSWDFSTEPIEVPGFKKKTAHLKFDSTKMKPEALKKLEDALYGTESTEPKLPKPKELIALLKDSVPGG